jgi:septum site-determining protein MinD
MGRIIAFASGKGGVGKTSITANVGVALAQRGKSVCLIDGDIAMANLSLLLGMQSSPITLHDVLLGEATIQDAIYDGPSGVKFVPSGLSLENYRRVDPERLESVISSLKEQFDFVLIDTPPGIERTVIAGLAAAEEIILITTPTSPSIADVLKTKIVTERLGSRPIGVIINFVFGDKGEVLPDDIMKMLELPAFGSVPYDEEMRKSFMQEKVSPVMVRAPTAPSAKAIQRIAAKIAGLPIEAEKPKGSNPLANILNSILSIFKKKK